MSQRFYIPHAQWVKPDEAVKEGSPAEGVAFVAHAGERLDIPCGGWRIDAQLDTEEMGVELGAFHTEIRKALIVLHPQKGSMMPIQIEAPTYASEEPHEHVGWRRVIDDRPQKITL
jgi:hypothetical protein